MTTIKTTGAEWNAFMGDDEYWSGGCWYDDAEIEVDGQDWQETDKDEVPATAKVVVDGGCVYLDEHGERSTSFASFFRKWRKAQTTAFLSVSCPKEREAEVRAAIEAAGGKAI
jgi:hypothetical protein